MAPDPTLPERYDQAMRIHGHGYGLYHTASYSDIRPGICGYVDSTGVWQHIVNLNDKKALERGGYTQIGHLVKAKGATEVWEETKSEGVKSAKTDASAGGNSGPVKATITFSLESSTENGAVLLCNTPVYREGLRDEEILRQWGKRNAKAILGNRPDVKQYGFYVTKAIWATEDVWINAWTNSERAVSIGFEVRAASAGQLAPKIQYSKSQSAGGWVHPVSTVEKNGNVERRVIFFKGVGFKFRLATAGVTWVAPMRGDDKGEPLEMFLLNDPRDEKVEYAVEVEPVGKPDDD